MGAVARLRGTIKSRRDRGVNVTGGYARPLKAANWIGWPKRDDGAGESRRRVLMGANGAMRGRRRGPNRRRGPFRPGHYGRIGRHGAAANRRLNAPASMTQTPLCPGRRHAPGASMRIVRLAPNSTRADRPSVAGWCRCSWRLWPRSCRGGRRRGAGGGVCGAGWSALCPWRRLARGPLVAGGGVGARRFRRRSRPGRWAPGWRLRWSGRRGGPAVSGRARGGRPAPVPRGAWVRHGVAARGWFGLRCGVFLLASGVRFLVWSRWLACCLSLPALGVALWSCCLATFSALWLSARVLEG